MSLREASDVPDRMDDERARDGLGQSREERGEEQQRHERGDPCDEVGTCVRAPAPSLTADADMLPPAIMPPNSALAMLANACAFSS